MYYRIEGLRTDLGVGKIMLALSRRLATMYGVQCIYQRKTGGGGKHGPSLESEHHKIMSA